MSEVAAGSLTVLEFEDVRRFSNNGDGGLDTE